MGLFRACLVHSVQYTARLHNPARDGSTTETTRWPRKGAREKDLQSKMIFDRITHFAVVRDMEPALAGMDAC